MSDLLDLAARVEAAEGPDVDYHALFRASFEAVFGDFATNADNPDVDARAAYFYRRSRFNHLLEAGGYLDAAMTLYVRVPERVPSNPRLAAAEALRQRAEAP